MRPPARNPAERSFDCCLFFSCRPGSRPRSPRPSSFLAGTNGFKDRDLYPSASTSPMASPKRPRISKGQGCKDLERRRRQKAYGEDIYKVARDGKVTEVSYMFPSWERQSRAPRSASSLKSATWGAVSATTSKSVCASAALPSARPPRNCARSFTSAITPHLSPPELLQCPRVRPDLRHVPDLVAVKVHHVHVVGLVQGLASWWARSPGTCVRSGENAVGADILARVIGRK
jgi:hypothetical protein